MGLLNKASESGLVKEQPVPAALDKPLLKKSNSVGLLKKSLNLADSNNRLDFFEFINKYDLQLCAVFNSQNGIFCIEQSAGLDGESICLSVSTADFWSGINQNQISDVLPFYQFFSSRLKDSIKNLNVYKRADGRIFLYCYGENQKASLQNDIENLKMPFAAFTSESATSLITVDYLEAIESLVLSQTKSQEKQRLIQAVSNQLYFNLLKNFPLPSHVIYEKTGTFKLDFINAKELPLEVLSNHLRLESEFVLGNHSQLISVEAEQ